METPCSVCIENIEALQTATCHYCGNKFHQPMVDTGHINCGRIMSLGEMLAIAYICHNCLKETEE
jgi:DNA-directed RNA polymerase subunit RPC12/RpoP